MADTLDSGKRRGFRSGVSNGSGQTGPGGTTRPIGGRPSRGPGGSTRPSSGASFGSSATNIPVSGGGASSQSTAHPELNNSQYGRKFAPGSGNGISSEDARLQQLKDEANASEAAKQAEPGKEAGDNRSTGERIKNFAKTLDDDPRSNSEKMAGGVSTRKNSLSQNAGQSGGLNTLPSTAPAGAAASGGSSSGPGSSKAPSSQNAFTAIGGNMQRNRSRWIAGGGIIGILVAITIGALSLLPLKLESLMKNILEKRIENRIDHDMETRADKYIQQYLHASVGNSDDDFEHSIVNYGQPIKDLYRTWRVSKLEDRLAAHQGVEFKRTATGIQVIKDGDVIGDYTGAEARAVLRVAVKSETKWYQVYLRHHLIKWEIVKYGVTRWGGWFRKLVNTKQAPATTDDEMASDTIDGASNAIVDEDAGIMKCALSEGDSCQTDPNNPEDTDSIIDGQPSDTGDANDADIENAVSEADQSAASQAKAYLHKIAQNVGNPDVKTDKLVGRILTKFLGEELSKDILSLVAAAKGPLIIIALVDIGSRIDHFFWYGDADKVLIAAHEVEYANEYANWTSMDDEWKDGKTISGDEFNSMQAPLEGIEKGQAFQNLYLNNTSGQPLTTVEDGNGGTSSNPFARSIDEHAHPLEDEYQAIFGTIQLPGSGGIEGQSGASLHNFFAAWYATGGKVWGAVNGILGAITSVVFGIIEDIFPPLRAAFTWLSANLSSWFIKLLLWLAQPAVDGTERAADLVNGLDAGGTVVGLGFARDLGAPQIGPTAAAQVDSEIAKENNAAANQLSIADRLFSTNYDHSLVNTLAVIVPTSPDEATQDSLDYFADLTQNPFKSFAPLLRLLGIGQAQAATADGADNLYGMYDWGYTDAQLQADDTAQIAQAEATATQRLGHTATLDELNLSDCPNVADPTTQPNVCRLDIATMQSLEATSTTSDDGGYNAPGGNP